MDIEIDIVNEWVCPNGTGVPLITMPNVPRALHGRGLQPRTIYGNSTWDYMRKKAYYEADYKCEICGREPSKRDLHAHELFDYDYENTTGTFNRVVAICRTCHDGIHSGRLFTMYKQGNPIYPKSYLLKVVENAFKLVHDYNESHHDEKKLKLYKTFVEYLNYPDLHEDMKRLIIKYDVEFYGEHLPKSKRWKGWKVVVGDRAYESPYKCQSDWEAAMSESSREDTSRKAEDKFVGAVYDEMEKIIEESKNKIRKVEIVTSIAGTKGGRLSKH